MHKICNLSYFSFCKVKTEKANELKIRPHKNQTPFCNTQNSMYYSIFPVKCNNIPHFSCNNRAIICSSVSKITDMWISKSLIEHFKPASIFLSGILLVR